MEKMDLVRATLFDSIKPRETMNIPDRTKFGLEIEIQGVDNSKKESIYNIDSNLKCKEDLSLNNSGFEIVTPVYKNIKKDLLLLKELSLTLKKLNPVFDNCSFQVNFNNKFSTKEEIDFIKVFSYYEKILYRFSKGIDRRFRDTINIYANLIYPEFIFEYKNNYYMPEYSLLYFQNAKRYGINFKTDVKLIEFRTPNGTIDYSLWFNYINSFYFLLDAIKNKKFDMQKIEKYILDYEHNLSEKYSLSYGDFEIELEKCLELIDILFTDDMDKIYFLNQYIGNSKEIIKQKYYH